MMWLFVPCHSAPGKVDWSSDSTSRVLESLSPHCTLNANSTQLVSLRRACKKEAYLLRLSGLTCEQSALQESAESWAASTASQAGSPVSPSLVPASVVARQILATYGPRLSRLWNATGQPLLFSRMCPALFPPPPSNIGRISWPTFPRCGQPRRRQRLGGDGILTVTLIDFTPSGFASSVYRRCFTLSPHWKDWATELRRACLARRKCLAAHTGGKGCSSWPTADANSSTYSNGHMGPNLRELAALWQTPSDPTYKYRRQVGQAGRAEELLPAQAENFPSSLPAPATEPPGQPSSQGGQDSRPLWSTPQVVMPRDRDVKARQMVRLREEGRQTGGIRNLRSDAGETAKKRLNPNFVDWLMGFPIGHSDSDSTVTPQYRNAWRQLSSLCLRHWLARVTEK